MSRVKRTGWRILVLAALLLINGFPLPAHAQLQEDCGVVDAIDYPIDGFSIEHDDFGLYRGIFNGYHAGIDLAFGRLGAPIRAAARGRVTFSDPEGWDTEKGVVVIEHIFPDGSTYFSLYGHMEERGGHTFPRVGACVDRGEIIGAVGRPRQSAPHLHYEIRRMRASTGGPGYWSADPLQAGWTHPIEFTERWRLRFNPAFRHMITATAAPSAPPLWQPDGSAVFISRTMIEQQTFQDETAWQLSVRNLAGVVNLPGGRILGRTLGNQMIVFEGGRFVASWQSDLPLRTAPLRLSEHIVFLTEDNRVVAYDADGSLRWQTGPLGTYVERHMVSGDLLAVAGEQDGAYLLWVINAAGEVVYAAAAPAPVIPLQAPTGGFLILVASQISLLDTTLQLRPLIDAGRALSRASQATYDQAGNIYVYPGYGTYLYAFGPDGALRWETRLPSPPMQAPLLGVGSGCLVYTLMPDGALLAYRAVDGALRGMAPLYAGGERQNANARYLSVLPGDQVRFSAGYLTVATVDGPALANMSDCGA
mgnify:FL=1